MINQAKVLILDDNVILCDLLSSMLQPMNFDVVKVHNYNKAVDAINTWYDVIIVDVFLSSSDKDTGINFIKQYIETHKEKKSKIVIITAHIELAKKLDLSGIYYDMFEEKPFSIEIFSKKIFELVYGDKSSFKSIDDTGKIRILQILVDTIKDDLCTMKDDLIKIKNDSFQNSERINYLEKEISSIRTSVATVVSSSDKIQQAVVSFMSKHADDNLKIIGSVSAIIVIALSVLGIILKM